MPSSEALEKQQIVPMIFRRHGDTAPKPRGHTLGDKKSATFYIRELEKQEMDQATALHGNTSSVSDRAPSLLTNSKPFAPAFIAQDKKVLRFSAYFLEGVHESNLENYRVRKCEVFYYLEDDTIQITEPKVENSGILQGNFVKRHRIPKPESDANGNMQFFSVLDFNIGEELTFYGRTFHLLSCDPFTRQVLQSQYGVDVPSDESTPRDAYSEIRRAQMQRETGQDPTANYGKKQYPMKEFMEVRLGKFVRPSDHLARFLAHDRQVLRFFAAWDDTSKLYGMFHHYTIHYFLADDTIEILEKYDRNSGCDPFPKLLNRAKLPRDEARQMSAAVCDSDTEESHARHAREHFVWQDFAIGKFVAIHHRQLRILDADDTTREWFQVNEMPLGSAIVLPEERKVIPIAPPPAHDGFGSDQDSLQSCYHLLPKAPLKSIESLDTTDILRFRARFNTEKPEDMHRRFVIAVIVTDQSVQVTELNQRNSGFVGGKFLERTRIKTSDGSGPFLGLLDFYVGARVKISGQVFVLFEMDEYSAKYMEAHAASFPRSNPVVVVQKLRGAMLDSSRLQMKPTSALDAEELTAKLEKVVLDFTHHDALTIVRTFGDKQAQTIPVDRLIELTA